MPINLVLCDTTTYDDLLYHKESYWNPFMGTKMHIYDAAQCHTILYYATYGRIYTKDTVGATMMYYTYSTPYCATLLHMMNYYTTRSLIGIYSWEQKCPFTMLHNAIQFCTMLHMEEFMYGLFWLALRSTI